MKENLFWSWAYVCLILYLISQFIRSSGRALHGKRLRFEFAFWSFFFDNFWITFQLFFIIYLIFSIVFNVSVYDLILKIKFNLFVDRKTLKNICKHKLNFKKNIHYVISLINSFPLIASRDIKGSIAGIRTCLKV